MRREGCDPSSDVGSHGRVDADGKLGGDIVQRRDHLCNDGVGMSRHPLRNSSATWKSARLGPSTSYRIGIWHRPPLSGGEAARPRESATTNHPQPMEHRAGLSD
jgi:hypothetical protein